MIRTFGYRISAIRKFHGFKRQVVPSDFDSKKKWTDNKQISENQFAEKGDKSGKNLYYPKYGNSIYDAQTIYKSITDLEEVKITNTTDYKEEDNRPDYDDEYDATGNGRQD